MAERQDEEGSVDRKLLECRRILSILRRILDKVRRKTEIAQVGDEELTQIAIRGGMTLAKLIYQDSLLKLG